MQELKILCESEGSSQVTISCPILYRKKIINDPFWKFFIPAIHLKTAVRKSSRCHIHTAFSKKFKLKSRGTKIFIKTNFSQEQIRDLIVICGYNLEQQRQRKKIYTIHGSLIAKGNAAVALIGAISGIGKTTIARHSQNKNSRGWSFLADEKFLLSGKDQQIINGITILDENQKRKHISPKYQEIISAFPKKIKLRLILFPILTDEKNLTVFPYAKEKLHWHLYEEASRDIRLINGMVNNFSTPLMSLDLEKIAQSRILDIYKISEKIPAFFVRGKVEKIYKFINQILKNQHKA